MHLVVIRILVYRFWLWTLVTEVGVLSCSSDNTRLLSLVSCCRHLLAVSSMTILWVTVSVNGPLLNADLRLLGPSMLSILLWEIIVETGITLLLSVPLSSIMLGPIRLRLIVSAQLACLSFVRTLLVTNRMPVVPYVVVMFGRQLLGGMMMLVLFRTGLIRNVMMPGLLSVPASVLRLLKLILWKFGAHGLKLLRVIGLLSKETTAAAWLRKPPWVIRTTVLLRAIFPP